LLFTLQWWLWLSITGWRLPLFALTKTLKHWRTPVDINFAFKSIINVLYQLSQLPSFHTLVSISCILWVLISSAGMNSLLSATLWSTCLLLPPCITPTPVSLSPVCTDFTCCFYKSTYKHTFFSFMRLPLTLLYLVCLLLKWSRALFIDGGCIDGVSIALTHRGERARDGL